MTSVDSTKSLREAAEIMRKRASHQSVPSETRWYVASDIGGDHVLASGTDSFGLPWDVARDLPSEELACHVSSWDPPVARAVAELIDTVADWEEGALEESPGQFGWKSTDLDPNDYRDALAEISFRARSLANSYLEYR